MLLFIGQSEVVARRARRSCVWLGLVSLMLFLSLGRAEAVSYLQEGFNYAEGNLGANAPWVISTNLISVTNLGLAYPYLTDFSPPANAVLVSEGNTTVTYRPFTRSATNGCVYFSLLIDFLGKPGNYYILGLTQATNAVPGGATDDPLDLIDETSGTGFSLGIRAKGGTSSYLTNGSLALSTNTPYFIVMKYNFTNGNVALYVNPPAGSTEPGTPDAASTAATVVPDLSNVYLRVGAAAAGNFLVSALRVASTWAEVTPATNATTAYSQAAMLATFLNSLRVDKYWQLGVSVNWLTGASGGTGSYKTVGTASHCSAFAGAVTDLLGVYLLRQPYISDLNLANHQADWLATNSMGWFPISTMTAAQHMVNTGLLVVASYKASSGSGHIAVLLPSNRTDASVSAFGPQECQSGDNNFSSTNISTGFNVHAGAFPNNILYYGHTINYPFSPVNPVLAGNGISNQKFSVSFNSIMGRPYQVQWSSDLVNWNTLSTFTNSNNSTNFYTSSIVLDPATSNEQRFYRVVGN